MFRSPQHTFYAREINISYAMHMDHTHVATGTLLFIRSMYRTLTEELFYFFYWKHLPVLLGFCYPRSLTIRL